ncbi:hypothetical protein PR002_g4183 [Phytophthora rubi]|uniref:Kinesin motor domain-containing protein n=1 Tax=Phytophthora rubi TaxID=129364 RepID=A0A6A3NNC6_9STRA|nr:hypothetical protein PR002_g4183 [Phytophthora rubi]
MTADSSRRERVEEQDSVKVCVRIRPLSSKEKQEQTKSCIRIAASLDGLSSSSSGSSRGESAGANKGPQQLIVGKDRAFTFDNVLGVTSSQAESYRLCVAPLVQGFLEGYNATVLAYGQTGTGKTHTMAGSGFDARGREKNAELQGIIPRVIKAVFKKLQQQDEGSDNQRRSEHTLRVEYVEIYNEELRDLLHPETASKQLAIREDGEGNIVIAGVKSEPADSKEAVFRHLVNIKNKPIVNDRVVREEERLRNDEEMSRMKEEIANLQTQLQQQKTVAPPSRPPSRPSSSTGKKEKNADQERELATLSRELTQATKCVHLYGDAVESIRTYSMEAATLLVAMEREIKSLGRPVQQRLNEIVKLLNASIQTANGSELSARKLLPSPSRRQLEKDVDPACQDEDSTQHVEETVVVQKLRHELKEAKTNLTRDEQIFEMKNADIQRLQALLVEAKGKNEKLIQRVQELERGGQLWSNVKVPGSSSDAQAKSRSPLAVDKLESKCSSRTTTASPSGRSSRTPSTSSGKTVSSSRGLFSRRGDTAGYEGNEDKVVMDNDDVAEEHRMHLAPRKSKSGGASGFTRDSSSSRGDSSRGSLTSGSRLKASEAIGKLETTITALQAKLEELQKKNEELLDAREESTRRWALERQNYEHQLSEAEHSIEALKRDNQVLEDSVLNDKRSEAKYDATSRSSIKSLGAKETLRSADHERPWPLSSSSKTSRPPTARRSHSNRPIDKEAVISAFESSVKELIEYHATRREVVHLLKGTKEAEQSRNEVARRVNALEMQKMRQSLGVRESISDLSKSLHALDERMQAESKSLEELERLKKLRVRAEQKLAALRKKEEQADFLDGEAQQELQDLEELIVDLDSHIAFQDAELVAARNDLLAIKQRSESTDAKSPLDGLANGLVQQLGLAGVEASGATATIMGKCLDEVARLRMRVSDMGNEVQELQTLLNEREAALSQLKSGLAVARDEFDRRLSAQRQEGAEAMEQLKKMQPQVLVPLNNEDDEATDSHKDEEWQKLIVRCQKKDEYIADLEKHLVFYKSKAKQMQAQLQQLIRSSSEQQRRSDSDDPSDAEREKQLQRRIQQLEDANDSLMKDLATAKVYLRASQSRGSTARTSGERSSAKVVRISRSELRELPAPPAAPLHASDQRED